MLSGKNDHLLLSYTLLSFLVSLIFLSPPFDSVKRPRGINFLKNKEKGKQLHENVPILGKI